MIPVIAVLVIGAVFVSVYLAAFHAPAPRQLPVAVIGAGNQGRVEHILDAAAPGGFRVRAYPTPDAARDALEHREVYAAYDRGAPASSLLIAGANGPGVTATVSAAFGAVVRADSTALEVRDVLPASAGDTRGLSVFYASFGVVLAGFLFGLVTYQTAPRLGCWWRLASLALFGVLSGLVVTLVAGETGFGALPGSFALLALVIVLLGTAAAGVTMVCIGKLGRAALGVAAIVLLTFGNATSGGILPPQYLPAWLHPLSWILPPGIGVRAVQGVAYFHHDALTAALIWLPVWIVVSAAVIYLSDVQRLRWKAPRAS
jgi:hypothetical protein